MARRMINIIGDGSIHDYVWLCKLHITTWAKLVNFGVDIDHAWANGGAFLGGQSSIGVF